MRSFKIFSMLFAAIFILVFTAEKSFAATTSVDWGRQVITVKGLGFPPAGNYPFEQAKQLAKRAAVAEAYRQLAEVVNGVKVSGETTVNNMSLVSDVVKTKVEATIKGVQPVSEREINGGYEVTIQMPLFGKTTSLAGAIFEKPAQKISFPEPVRNVAPTVPTYTARTPVKQRIDIVVKGAANVTVNKIPMSSNYAENNFVPMSSINISSLPSMESPSIISPAPVQPQIKIPTPSTPQIKLPEIQTPTVPQVTTPQTPKVETPKVETVKPVKIDEDKISAATVDGKVTGLIVDCRELNLQPVMSPTIKNESEETIYGDKNLDYDKIIEKGMAAYVTEVDEIVTERAGDNPLVVKATGLENFNSNPVVSTADSNRILIENKSSKFLDDMNVVFLM